MISAWSTRQNLVLGQAKVADKSNEIVALPKLLDLLTINGATVTIDAMGCQRNIAAKIIDKDADYILALKGNQGSLHDDTKLFFIEQIACGFADTVVSHHQTVEKSHGRIETRTTTATNEIAWLKERHHWPGPGSIVMVETVREIGIQPGAKVERETRFYIRLHRRQGRYSERRHPGPLEQRERAALGHGPALGHGHGLPRRRVPGPKEHCPGQLRGRQTHGEQPLAPSPGQGQSACKTTHRCLGRRLPRKPYLTVKPFTRLPWRLRPMI